MYINGQNTDIWILIKEQKLFRSKCFMCVPYLVKIDWTLMEQGDLDDAQEITAVWTYLRDNQVEQLFKLSSIPQPTQIFFSKGYYYATHLIHIIVK